MKTILQAVKEKLTASGSTIADGLGGKGLTVSEAIDALELEGGEGITPTGNIKITANTGSGGVDISQYATLTVEVVAYLVTLDANNGTDDPTYLSAIGGDSLALPDGSDLTVPSGKAFGGWLLDPSDQVSIEANTLQVTGDTTVYARWINAT